MLLHFHIGSDLEKSRFNQIVIFVGSSLIKVSESKCLRF